jgi:hypothetical protein
MRSSPASIPALRDGRCQSEAEVDRKGKIALPPAGTDDAERSRGTRRDGTTPDEPTASTPEDDLLHRRPVITDPYCAQDRESRPRRPSPSRSPALCAVQPHPPQSLTVLQPSRPEPRQILLRLCPTSSGTTCTHVTADIESAGNEMLVANGEVPDTDIGSALRAVAVRTG